MRHALVLIGLILLAVATLAGTAIMCGCPEPQPLDELNGPDGGTAGANNGEEAPQDVVAEVDRLHATRPGLSADEDIKTLRQELTILGAALKGDSENVELLWRASRTCSLLAKRLTDRKLDYAHQGKEFADKCVQLAPDRVECHYYRAINHGLKLEANQLSALGGLDDLVAYAHEAARLDLTYDHGGPGRMLAQIYFQAPGPPLGPGDDEQAARWIDRTIQAASDWPENFLLKGEIALDRDDEEGARAAYQQVLALPIPEEAPRDGRRWQAEARRALQELDD